MADDDSTRQGGLFAHFEKLAQEAQAFPPAPDAKPVEPEPLGEWAEYLRGCPNVVLRAALFTAGKPTKTRKLYRDHALPAAIGAKSITYTGPQLYQYELDVWLEVMHRCRTQAPGIETSFHAYGFLKTLRRTDGKANYKQLASTLQLLQATSINVVQERDERGRAKGFSGSLVDNFRYDEVTGMWRVRLDPEIAELFAPKEHTWLHLDARLDLGKNYLAKWLHGYFSSHRKPLPISVSRLRELSGSSTSELRRFRFALRAALREVEGVEKKHRRRFEWRVDGEDLVHVVRESGN
jgi:hypothetical protein